MGEMWRTCSKCLIAYPSEFFNSDRTKTDGKHPHCKNCTRRNANRSYQRYRDEHLAQKRAWKEANPERNAEINRQWRLDNPEAVRAASARYRARQKRAALLSSECIPPKIGQGSTKTPVDAGGHYHL